MLPSDIAEAIERILKVMSCKGYSSSPDIIFGISDRDGKINYLYASDLHLVLDAAWMYSELLD